MNKKLFAQSLALLLLMIAPSLSWAACSSAYGKAFINEFNTNSQNLEVYFSPSAPTGDYIVRLCNADGCVDQTFPYDQSSYWVVRQLSNIANNDDFDITLYYPAGQVADYVNVHRGSGTRLFFNNDYLSCPDITENIAAHLIYRNNSGQRHFYRTIDGGGVWVETQQKSDNSFGESNHGADPPPPPVVHHIRLLHDGQGLTCLPETVTIRACQDADCALYVGSVTVTLSPTTGWVGGNSLTFSGGESTAYLRRTTPGAVTLGATTTATTNATRCFNGATESCALVFAEAGFVIDVPDLIANKPDGPVTIRAVKAADDGVSCAPAFTGSRTVNFWSNYENPNTGTMTVSLDGTSIGTISPGTQLNLTFDSNAQATIPAIRYSDAGQMRFNARFEGSGVEAGLVLEGNDLFVSRPVGLAVISSDPNAECVSGDHTCTVFRRAGEDFNLTVRGVAWTHEGDTTLNDNPITPNYRQSGISLGHDLIAPDTGILGSIGATQVDIGAGGELAFAQSVSEVGVFRFAAIPPESTYFGYTVPGGESYNVGRFIPDRFEIEDILPGTLVSACNNFTYTGQTIEGYVADEAPQFTIRAFNALTPSQTTQNYTGDFAKLEAPNIDLNGPIDDADADQLGNDEINNVLVDTWLESGIIVDNGNGTLTYTASYNDEFMYQRDNALISPFSSRILLQLDAMEDSDDVAAVGLPQNVEVGGTEIRYGRISLENAYGSELLSLNVPMKAEYFYQGSFQTNTDDECTELTLINHLELKEDEGVWVDGTNSINVGAGSTSGSIANLPLAGGVTGLSFSAPGAENAGSFYVRTNIAADYPWLLYDWNNDGTPTNPTAKATFGIYKGNPRLIYMRESVW